MQTAPGKLPKDLGLRARPLQSRYLDQWGYKHSFLDSEHLEEEYRYTFTVLKSLLTTNSQHYSMFTPYSRTESRRRSRRSRRTAWYQGPLPEITRPLDDRRQRVAYRRLSLYVGLYSDFTNYFFIKFFHYVKALMNRKLMVEYDLFFNFREHRLFVTLHNNKGQNYFSLAVGIFLKFFKNKKSLRKNKTLRFLLAKYVRKLLILANIKNLYLHVRKTPILFQELLNLLLRPLIKPMVDPTNGRVINETAANHFDLNIIALIFSHSRSFATRKIRKKGRIKRKIRRRLFRLNNVLD